MITWIDKNGKTYYPEDLTVEFVHANSKAVIIAWSLKEYGFGRIEIDIRKNRTEFLYPVRMDTETLGKAFARFVLDKVLRDATYDTEGA